MILANRAFHLEILGIFHSSWFEWRLAEAIQELPDPISALARAARLIRVADEEARSLFHKVREAYKLHPLPPVGGSSRY